MAQHIPSTTEHKPHDHETSELYRWSLSIDTYEIHKGKRHIRTRLERYSYKVRKTATALLSSLGFEDDPLVQKIDRNGVGIHTFVTTEERAMKFITLLREHMDDDISFMKDVRIS